MKKITALALVIGLVLALTPAADAWDSYVDFNDSMLPPPPWIEFFNEGSAVFVDVVNDPGNKALRLDSPAHSDGTGTHYNEYYVGTLFDYTEAVGAARFRLESFDATGKENLLSVTVGGDQFVDEDGETAPSITLVDGNFHLWSYTSDEPVPIPSSAMGLLGPADNAFHEAYILARANGTAQVWWDGVMVLDGPVPVVTDFQGYVEFGSGTYWQTTAATVVDFDWVAWGALRADYNYDGKVDAADYVMWRDTGVYAILPDPDTGDPGDPDHGYDLWRENFGEMVPLPGSGSALGAGAVPEPATWICCS